MAGESKKKAVKSTETSFSFARLFSRRERFKDAEELENRLNEYFSLCEKLQAPVTYTGLMLSLGLSDKSSLSGLRYHSEYGDMIRTAISIVEGYYEARLSGNNAVGAIFALKNFGWSDRTDIAISDADPNKVALKESQLAVLNAGRAAFKELMESASNSNQD